MAEFDYATWVARAQAFTGALGRLAGAEVRSTAVAPPVREAELAPVERTLGARLPASLRAFFTRGAAGLDCGYAFEPGGEALDRLQGLLPDEERIYGGARIGPVSELPDFSAGVHGWAEDTWIAEEPAQRIIWESALPFARLDNGDYLALDLRTGEADPPVVYLSHDDDSSSIAPNLVAFLDAWERLCYLGPEHWLLLEFTDAEGNLDPDSDRAARLRDLFAG